MDCRTVKEELVAFLDNEGSATLKAEIEEHLKACPGCAQEMRALQASWQMLDSSLPPAVGAGFTASVMSSVREVPSNLPLITVSISLVLFLIGFVLWDHFHWPVKAPVKESRVTAPVSAGVAVSPKVTVPVSVAAPLAVQTLPAVKPAVILPAPVQMAPVVIAPVAVKTDKDKDIIANLDMYENAEMLKKMDGVSDMDVVSSIKAKSS